MTVNFQITKNFEKDLKKFGTDDKHIITDCINTYCSILAQKGKVRTRQLYQPYQIELKGNFDSSLYHYLKHLQRFRFISEFRTEKLCVTLRLKSARQNYQNVLSIGIYILKVTRKIRVILTIDEDPLFNQFIIKLLRVVSTDEAERAYMSVSQSLYQPLFAHAR